MLKLPGKWDITNVTMSKTENSLRKFRFFPGCVNDISKFVYFGVLTPITMENRLIYIENISFLSRNWGSRDQIL